MVFLWLTVVILTICVLYISDKRKHFDKLGLRSVKGIPILGATYRMTIGLEPTTKTISNLYQKFKTESIFGIFDTITPIIFVRDPEIIKQITIKDFDHFVNHILFIDHGIDPMMEKNLFFMRDQRWRDMRATLSPAFTGSKMRIMFQFIEESSNAFVQHLLKENSEQCTNYEMKDLFTRYASDTIASCAFGLHVNSLENKENEFYTTGRSMTNFSTWAGIKFVLLNNFPQVLKFFKLKLLSTKDINYLRGVINETINYRQLNDVVRPDMVHLLMEAKKGTLTHEKPIDINKNADALEDEDIGFATVQESNVGKVNTIKAQKWTDDDILAQCMIFFFAGFDTVSTVTSFMAHELAINQNVQEKLYEEIKAINEKLLQDNGHQSITYDVLQKMKYLDQVVCETLRKWPPAITIDRQVSKPYTLEYGSGKKLLLNIGDGIWIPVYGLHMDEKYFPNPKQFDPERFNDVNKKLIPAGVYNPFGIGPRNCIGSRFALMECKSLMYHLLLNFRLEKCDKTQDPIRLRCVPFAMTSEKGFHLKLTKRS